MFEGAFKKVLLKLNSAVCQRRETIKLIIIFPLQCFERQFEHIYSQWALNNSKLKMFNSADKRNSWLQMTFDIFFSFFVFDQNTNTRLRKQEKITLLSNDCGNFGCVFVELPPPALLIPCISSSLQQKKKEEKKFIFVLRLYYNLFVTLNQILDQKDESLQSWQLISRESSQKLKNR